MQFTTSNLDSEPSFKNLLPWKMFKDLLGYRNLIKQLVSREVVERYRGSMLGIFWSFLNPLMMLAVYTAVFGYIFQGRFTAGEGEESRVEFALALFCGLNLYHFIAENISRAPTIILNQPNYVKKVVFPLQILPLITLFGAVFHLVIANIPLLLGLLIFKHSIPWTSVFVLLYFIPLALITIGLSWFLSSVGVFFRDVRVLVGPVILVLMYASAIFYPFESVPENWRWVVWWNPLAQIIHESRNAMIFGKVPDMGIWLIITLLSMVVAMTGYWFFMKTKRWFADVM